MESVQHAYSRSMPALNFSPLESDAIMNHENHLSGMTLADFSGANLSREQPTSPSLIRSKRASRTSISTTKSELRQTNSILVGMLQNIQAELASHRAILLNIQNRVSTLESEYGSEFGFSSSSLSSFGTSEYEDASPPTLPVPLPIDQTTPSPRDSKLAPEIADWWQACQTFAQNAEPPMSARDFLRTPQRFSGFDFRWETPSSPPNVEDLPDLIPTIEEDRSSDDDESPSGKNVYLGAGEEFAVERAKDTKVDIRHRTIEFDVRKPPPRPPVLQPAPGAKPVVVDVDSRVVATEPEVVDGTNRFFKGIRSLVTYKALLKQKGGEKGKTIAEV